MTSIMKLRKFHHPIASLGRRINWKMGLRSAIICVLILALLPFWPTPQPAYARGFFGRLSRVIPFVGVVVGWSHRNRIYRTSEQFISDRNQYYDGLLDMARTQLHNKEITTVGRTRAAAYIKVYAMIEQERAGQLAVAEGRKRQARAEFHGRVKEAIIYSAVGGRIAQELIGTMLNGVNSMQQMLDRALSKLTSGGSDALQDLRRIKKIAYTLENLSSIVGGKVGAKIGIASARVAKAIEDAEMGAVNFGMEVQADLQELHNELFILKEVGRKPTAGEVIDHVEGRFLPEPDEKGNIPLEAIASILSDLEVGDGSLKDEARRALNAGFVARCAEFSNAFQAQLESLKKSSQEESTTDPETSPCESLNPKLKKQQAEDNKVIDEFLEFEEGPKIELPRVTASGTLSEAMSGALSTANPMGTTFQLTADFEAGTINGTLKGSRTSTPGGWMNCFDPANPSLEVERIDVNTAESYEASFSGSIDKETGDFNIAITPTGRTSATKVTLFTNEYCLPLNSKKYSGDHGWNGIGTISGGVSKDGGIEFNTDWSYTWFTGEVQVSGRWSGNGIVTSP